MTAVFLNGRFYSPGEATVSAFDAGLQHGVGLFETMSGRVGPLSSGEAVIHRLDDHLDRLIESARALGLTESLRKHALADAVCRTVEHAANGAADPPGRWRVRLTVTGGDLNLLERRIEGSAPKGGSPGVTPTVMIVAQPATEYPPEMFERGVSAVIADWRVNPLDPLAGHKTLNYWGRLRALTEAARSHAGEAIVFQVSNHLAGGCVSNVFLVKDGRLLTPIARGEEGGERGEGGGERRGAYLPSPVLPGVTRREIMEHARERGVECERKMLNIDDLLGADEVFLTNSSWGVLPVVRVERSSIGDGNVGELTRDLLRAGREAADA